MLQIITGPKQCVRTAVSTMRLAMGYKELWPKGVPGPDANTGWRTDQIAKYARALFPGRTIRVWCSGTVSKRAGLFPDEYAGDTLNNLDESGKVLTMFCYYINEQDGGHAVIGHPCLYGDMKVSLVLQVSLNKERKR